MRILVIEDKEIHCQSARETLSGHEVTIVRSFDEAMNLMSGSSFGFFEVVLADMMMPMSKETLASEAFKAGEQVPYGFITTLKGALCGAKFVAMVTDVNHHDDAMSAAIDHFDNGYHRDCVKPNFVINGARAMFIQTPFVEEIIDGKQRKFRKDWGQVLADLTRPTDTIQTPVVRRSRVRQCWYRVSNFFGL